MKLFAFYFFILLIGLIIISLLIAGIIYTICHWRRLIWESRGKVFRITRKGNFYYPEKQFLHFFFVQPEDDCAQYSKKDALNYIQRFLQGQIVERELLNFSNQINDPTKLIESKQLETKRIKYK